MILKNADLWFVSEYHRSDVKLVAFLSLYSEAKWWSLSRAPKQTSDLLVTEKPLVNMLAIKVTRSQT